MSRGLLGMGRESDCVVVGLDSLSVVLAGRLSLWSAYFGHAARIPAGPGLRRHAKDLRDQGSPRVNNPVNGWSSCEWRRCQNRSDERRRQRPGIGRAGLSGR